eukprot:scaffold5293_cov114-Isochrysis_galbana.AAC.4
MWPPTVAPPAAFMRMHAHAHHALNTAHHSFAAYFHLLAGHRATAPREERAEGARGMRQSQTGEKHSCL